MLLLSIEVLAQFNCQITTVVLEILLGNSLRPRGRECVPSIDEGCCEPIVHGIPLHSMTIETATLERPGLTMHLPIESVAAIESSIVVVENWSRVWGLFSLHNFKACRIGHFLPNGAVNGPMEHDSLPSLVVV